MNELTNVAMDDFEIQMNPMWIMNYSLMYGGS